MPRRGNPVVPSDNAPNTLLLFGPLPKSNMREKLPYDRKKTQPSTVNVFPNQTPSGTSTYCEAPIIFRFSEAPAPAVAGSLRGLTATFTVPVLLRVPSVTTYVIVSEP